DFGLVKDMEGMSASVTGGVTPVYAAPETFEGRVSRYCDQYSLAIVYQELLTGQRPFNGNNARELLLQHVQMPPNLNPLPLGERRITARRQSKTPDARYPTGANMGAALRSSASSPIPPPLEQPAPMFGDEVVTRNIRTPQPPGPVSVTPRPVPAGNVVRTPRS